MPSLLYNSVVRVERPVLTLPFGGGDPELSYVQAHDDDPLLDYLLGYLECRIDLLYFRPGKDVPSPIGAGGAQPRTGVLFCDPDVPLRAGDRLVTIDNGDGVQPVSGIFEMRNKPDYAMGFHGAHHIEVQIIESGQVKIADAWIGDTPLPDPGDVAL